MLAACKSLFLSQIQNWIEDFVAEYPSIASKDVVGTSYEGREFAALTVSIEKLL